MALLTPDFLQTKTYQAIRDRLALAHGGAIQAGVWDANDFKVTQRGAGEMAVDVAAGFALVPANQAGNKGLYHVENDAAVAVTIPSNGAANPRLDQIVLRVDDTVDGAGTDDLPRLEVVQGTATAGATLDNRTGAGNLPTGALRLADILVGAGDTAITTAEIRDRRQRARGAHFYIERTANASGTDDYRNNSTTSVAIDATNLYPRIECSGVPVLMRLRGRWDAGNPGQAQAVYPVVDGVSQAGTLNGSATMSIESTVGDGFRVVEWEFTPAAGSHRLGFYWHTGATGQARQPGLYAQAALKAQFEIAEILRPVASND